MDSLLFFDCNAFVGKRGYKHPRQIWRTEHILAEMERSGIAGALVYHGMARAHSPEYGNGQLAGELARNPRLFGCWTALPDHAGDFPAPDRLIPALRAQAIRAVTLFPKTHQFETDARTTGKLLAALERARMPLLLQADEVPLPQLGELLQRHPQLSVLLLGCYWGQERRLFPLLEEYPNVGIDLSNLQSNRIIETVCARFGAERMYFGSGMPLKSPGAARALVDYADVPHEAKRLIAGGNLCRLLGVEPPPDAAFRPDAIALQASRGRPIHAALVLDSHTHLIEDGGRTGSGMPMIGGDIEAMIGAYRKLGIRRMSIAPWVGINGGDAQTGNAVAEEARRRYPDEVGCYAVIDPNYTPDVAAEADLWHRVRRFQGMKPYYYLSRIPYTDPVYAPWWKLANELRLYALVDPGLIGDREYVDWIDELAVRYPQVNLFMDHAGRSFEIAELYAPMARKHANVTLQLTYTSVPLGVIEYLVELVGPGNILFGTDSPMRDPRPQLGWLAHANISPEAKAAILGGNFRSIMQQVRLPESGSSIF